MTGQSLTVWGVQLGYFALFSYAVYPGIWKIALAIKCIAINWLQLIDWNTWSKPIN